jgi:hypothetical protein
MSSFLIIMQVLGQLLPIIVQTIKSVEEVLPGSGQGPAKLSMVKTMLQNAVTAAGQMEVTFEQLWPAMQSVITILVAAYNATGAFKKAG